jgi:hypothetical protein
MGEVRWGWVRMGEVRMGEVRWGWARWGWVRWECRYHFILVSSNKVLTYMYHDSKHQAEFVGVTMRSLPHFPQRIWCKTRSWGSVSGQASTVYSTHAPYKCLLYRRWPSCHLFAYMPHWHHVPHYHRPQYCHIRRYLSVGALNRGWIEQVRSSYIPLWESLLHVY